MEVASCRKKWEIVEFAHFAFIINIFHSNQVRQHDWSELISQAHLKDLPLQFMKATFCEELDRCGAMTAAPGGRSGKQKGACLVADHFATQVAQGPQIAVGCCC